MTLLTSRDIEHICAGLETYDSRLLAATGSSLSGLACAAAGIAVSEARQLIQGTRVVCVPMSCGGGVIRGFVEALTSIAGHLGFKAEASTESDAAGLAQAYRRRADIILTADDHRFVAINTRTRLVVDNGDATGRAFAWALNGLADGLEDKHVLVIGCGPVGRGALKALLEMKARVALFDIDNRLCREIVQREAFQSGNEPRVESDLRKALRAYPHIVDATPALDLIDATAITPRTCISAPGVPCGVSNAARRMLGDRLIHDPLQLGVAAMLAQSL